MNEENNLEKSITQASNSVKTPSMTSTMNPLIPSVNEPKVNKQTNVSQISPLVVTQQPSPLETQMTSTMNVARNAIRQRSKMPEPRPAQGQGLQQEQPKSMQQGDAIMQLLTNANKMTEQVNAPTQVQTAQQYQTKAQKVEQPKIETIGGNYAQSIGMTNYKFRKHQDPVPSYQYNDTTILMPEGVDINDDEAVNYAVSNINSMVDMMNDMYS